MSVSNANCVRRGRSVEKPEGIYSPTFVTNEFSRLFLHPSISSIVLEDLHK